nr:hypothetical protein [Pandoravirus massiliensis]
MATHFPALFCAFSFGAECYAPLFFFGGLPCVRALPLFFWLRPAQPPPAQEANGGERTRTLYSFSLCPPPLVFFFSWWKHNSRRGHSVLPEGPFFSFGNVLRKCIHVGDFGRGTTHAPSWQNPWAAAPALPREGCEKRVIVGRLCVAVADFFPLHTTACLMSTGEK